MDEAQLQEFVKRFLNGPIALSKKRKSEIRNNPLCRTAQEELAVILPRIFPEQGPLAETLRYIERLVRNNTPPDIRFFRRFIRTLEQIEDEIDFVMSEPKMHSWAHPDKNLVPEKYNHFKEMIISDRKHFSEILNKMISKGLYKKGRKVDSIQQYHIGALYNRLERYKSSDWKQIKITGDYGNFLGRESKGNKQLPITSRRLIVIASLAVGVFITENTIYDLTGSR